MLNYFLSITKDILNEASNLSKKEKELVYDQVSYAVRQTKSHINATRTNGKDKSSPIISNAWQRASQRIKTVNNPNIKRFAETIEEKSKYWADPISYNTAQFDDFEMRIFQVETTLEKLCK
ncbi:hypothetical protein SAMN05444410_10845 [Hydrobacter penzbergensis]|uniref:Uncharacterized protein n=1 Tax=Hydrobacter penzbergensis TaxID=1235997 RepID=A0A8X8LDW5_9BACT|nr:hypothetical protein [Hydrobacter penzbergensis]SDX01739.1 hypothetical protein SAMN05444410_10845 [Hydrobacter penzbergensis]